tara:strand:+ start:2631 stop:4385 length:1755 start_codon:yes stop_codon:yes gene_type:complete
MESAAAEPSEVPLKEAERTAEQATEHALEGNTIAACCVLVFAVSLDAFTSLPTTILVDIPASTRFSSLTMAALVAAPPIDCLYLFEQRGLGVILLVIVSLAGLHHGAIHARLADAVYSIVGGLALVSFYALSGLKPGEPLYDGKGKRENTVALSAALLVYVGIRALRAGLSHATEVVQFTVSHDDFTTRGYAVADDTSAFFNTFGAALVVCSGIVVLLNHDSVYEHGSRTVSPVTAMLSVLVYTAAFVSMLSGFARMDDMGAVFGDSACTSDVAVCATAYRARRFYMANTIGPTCMLVAAAVAMTLLAFPRDRRCQNRRDYYSSEELRQVSWAASGSGIVAVVAVVGAVISTVVFGDASSMLPGIEVSLLYVSIPLAWFQNSSIACALHVAGQLAYTADKLGSPFGFDLSYYTHLSTAASIFLICILTVTTGISKLLYSSCCFMGKYVDWVDIVTAVCMVMLTSVQMILTLLTLATVSGFDGGMVADYRSWAVFGLEWAIQHTLTFFFAAALVGGRYEIHTPWISSTLLRLFWFQGPVLLLLGWATSVAVRGSNPYESQANMTVVVVGSLAAVVPWAVIGAVVC